MARVKLTGFAAALESAAKHARRTSQPRDEFGRFKPRRVELTEREIREIPAQRELVKKERKRLKKLRRETEIVLTYAERIREGREEFGMKVDESWMRDTWDDWADDYDLDLHDVYEDYFGYGSVGEF